MIINHLYKPRIVLPFSLISTDLYLWEEIKGKFVMGFNATYNGRNFEN